jgi:hypothetical protein
MFRANPVRRTPHWPDDGLPIPNPGKVRFAGQPGVNGDRAFCRY